MIPTLLAFERHWSCPNCDLTDVTRRADEHSRFHACPGLKGLTAPMVPAGTRAKVEARVREDYLNGDIVDRDDDGRPIMSVITTRDEGEDCTVYAPLVVTNNRA